MIKDGWSIYYHEKWTIPGIVHFEDSTLQQAIQRPELILKQESWNISSFYPSEFNIGHRFLSLKKYIYLKTRAQADYRSDPFRFSLENYVCTFK